MIVKIPGPLLSYTKNQNMLDITASTLLELTQRLDQKFPGIKFRIIDEQENIRAHIKIFVNKTEANDLSIELNSTDTIQITCALSGG